jgi:hypothetical protein
MAEQRIDGTCLANEPATVLASSPRETNTRADGFVAGEFGGSGGGVTTQKFTMRAWSASLGCFVTWIATLLDTTGSQAPAGSGTLSDIVWLRTI